MAEKDDDYNQTKNDEERFRDPKPRGGRRKDGAKRVMNPKSLENLKKAQWKPGQSGNPAGLPKSLVEITKLARQCAPSAIARLHKIAHDPSASHRDQIAASIALLDRGFGRPAVAVLNLGNTTDNPLSGAPEETVLLPSPGMTALLISARAANERAKAGNAQAKKRPNDHAR